jgi:hypothetical protein
MLCALCCTSHLRSQTDRQREVDAIVALSPDSIACRHPQLWRIFDGGAGLAACADRLARMPPGMHRDQRCAKPHGVLHAMICIGVS